MNNFKRIIVIATRHTEQSLDFNLGALDHFLLLGNSNVQHAVSQGGRYAGALLKLLRRLQPDLVNISNGHRFPKEIMVAYIVQTIRQSIEFIKL